MTTRATVAYEAIERLAAAGLEPRELVAEVSARVQRVVPHDWAAWATADPGTRLDTDVVVIEPFLDCCFYSDLVAGGDRRAALAARGLDAELRADARSADATWGSATLARAAGEPEFSADEVRWVAAVAGELGRGLRAGLSTTPALPAGGGPGMVVLDADAHVEAATGTAERWLARLPSPYPAGYAPPAVEAVALAAPARARVPVPGEGWLAVHADTLGDGRTAVMIEPATRAELRPLLMALHGLTARERAVTALLVAGLDTAAIADELAISRHTLRDHVKAIFAKVGVASRAELTARL